MELGRMEPLWLLHLLMLLSLQFQHTVSYFEAGDKWKPPRSCTCQESCSCVWDQPGAHTPSGSALDWNERLVADSRERAFGVGETAYSLYYAGSEWVQGGIIKSELPIFIVGRAADLVSTEQQKRRESIHWESDVENRRKRQTERIVGSVGFVNVVFPSLNPEEETDLGPLSDAATAASGTLSDIEVEDIRRHLLALKLGLQTGSPVFGVFSDDLLLAGSPQSINSNIAKATGCVPADFDILSLHSENEQCSELTEVNNCGVLARAHNSRSVSAMLFSEQGALKSIARISTMFLNLPNMYAELTKYGDLLTYVVNPVPFFSNQFWHPVVQKGALKARRNTPLSFPCRKENDMELTLSLVHFIGHDTTSQASLFKTTDNLGTVMSESTVGIQFFCDSLGNLVEIGSAADAHGTEPVLLRISPQCDCSEDVFNCNIHVQQLDHQSIAISTKTVALNPNMIVDDPPRWLDFCFILHKGFESEAIKSLPNRSSRVIQMGWESQDIVPVGLREVVRKVDQIFAIPQIKFHFLVIPSSNTLSENVWQPDGGVWKKMTQYLKYWKPIVSVTGEVRVAFDEDSARVFEMQVADGMDSSVASLVAISGDLKSMVDIAGESDGIEHLFKTLGQQTQTVSFLLLPLRNSQNQSGHLYDLAIPVALQKVTNDGLCACLQLEGKDWLAPPKWFEWQSGTPANLLVLHREVSRSVKSIHPDLTLASHQWSGTSSSSSSMTHLLTEENFLRNLPPQRSDRVLIYYCSNEFRCGGLGDRMVGMMSVYILAVMTNRSFAILSDHPVPLRTMLQPNRYYDWDRASEYSDGPHLNWIQTCFPDLDNFEIEFGNTPVIRVTANMELFTALRKSALYNKPEMHLYFGEWFPLFYRFMFKPTQSVLQAGGEALRVMSREGASVSCAQVRVGWNDAISWTDGFQAFGLQSSNDMPDLTFLQRVWDILAGRPGTDLIYVSSDTEMVIEEAQALFGDRLLRMKGKITHLELSEPEEAAEHAAYTFASLHAFTYCNAMVFMRSGYGELAASTLRRRSNTRLFFVFPTGVYRLDPSMFHLYKQDCGVLFLQHKWNTTVFANHVDRLALEKFEASSMHDLHKTTIEAQTCSWFNIAVDL